jgi:phage-related protein
LGIDINFYTKENEEIPFKKFYNKMNKTVKSEILRMIELLQEYGNKLKLPHSRLMKDGIFELRFSAEDKYFRILYFFTSDKKVIITNCFIKKTNNIPSAEIEKAKKYKKDYEERYV